MPGESTRKTSMLRVTAPFDSSLFVDIKIINQISFVDQHAYAQETTFGIDNSFRNMVRKVRVQRVENPTDLSSFIDVERVLQWNVRDQHDYAQDTFLGMLGNAEGNEPPVHLKTHIKRIFNDSDPNIWIDMQRIDEIKFRDLHNYAQDTIYTLVHPDDDQDNPSSLDTSSDGTQINPPWRFDPFQNPINVQWGRAHHAHMGPLQQWWADMLPIDRGGYLRVPSFGFEGPGTNCGTYHAADLNEFHYGNPNTFSPPTPPEYADFAMEAAFVALELAHVPISGVPYMLVVFP